MIFTKNLHDLRTIAIVLASALSLCAAPAAAQVLQIEDDGHYVVHDGAAVTTVDDVKPIVDPAPIRIISTAPAVSAGALEGVFRTTASEFGLDPRLLHAVAWHESRFRQEAVSSKGAVGVMQLMPGTARTLGVNPFDVVQNIRGGAALLARLLREFGGNVQLTLAAYNAGANSVHRYGGVPPYPETQSYVADIMQRLAAMAPGD
ncbi:lytic transglycosylase domain-containing protein [Sphingomonas nostoxanthinifaciens]|uniref:lytic transglycosylase domain-containing protein n=1 Tax=Sphingomonas nostoxanthinifaciens TaxID=2872652 RepID=UPI001CC21281|nr:lytic transglycosylase domain-containing protein [Sphingomonas nostoxanthinifaciens]UAK23252.1 lytic transglycosylase domain-containing protein [Sphingomonas nostoxanthinifaciens]